MWNLLGKAILRYGYVLLLALLGITAFLGWRASKVKLSYEFAKAIPTDNPKYVAYQEFRKKFGDDGNLLVVGIQTDSFFHQQFFNDYKALHHHLKKLKGVDDIVSVPMAINLVRNEATEKLQASPVFPDTVLTQQQIDSSKNVFLNLPFYKGLLYNPDTHAWLMGLRMNTALINSAERTDIVNNIVKDVNEFAAAHKIEVHLSGLPYIRTVTSYRIENEMRFFLVGSVLLSALILLLFFRSASAMLLSLAVVIVGVIWSVGVLNLSGYKITILTALIPPLVVVIGIPNCIYFLNKYHTTFRQTGDKKAAIVAMVGKMGVVTLFCNIAAAIGFAVFALTQSAILKEFGVVAGISIMSLFFISLILIPVVLNLLPAPKARHTKYLDNAWLQRWLDGLERWSSHHRKLIYSVTVIILVIAVAGIFKLKSVGHIVDDLPKGDKVYTDLKFFEENFKGVMPLEIVIDTKRINGLRGSRALVTYRKIDSLSKYITSMPDMARPLSITEGLKFVKQAFFEGDSAQYSMPGENDLLALRSYLSTDNDSAASQNSFSKLVASFIDSSKRETRISVSMKDIGSIRLPLVLDSIQKKSSQLFDSSKYNVQFTGTSVTFLEGSRFIINGLKDSVLWAFLLIALCMLYLFKSFRVLLCSLIPNVIPLIITAGVMGWTGVPLKPSTVLVFSVALGIAIDITIRFLVNYKQQLKENSADVFQTVIETIHSTGLSIIYTSIVLIAGFVIFCFSGFGGTKALGWLTSLTLITATFANLVLLPALIISFYSRKK
ncbi:MAG: efflux RND transporter permease subunit [Flavisolibacter sp.]